MSLLTSKVIQNPFRSQKCPPRLLGGCSGDSKENVLFHWTEGPEILYIAYLMFIHVSFGVQIHIHYTQEERISSKTPWRIIWRLIGECPLPVNLKAFKFAQSFLNVYIYINLNVRIHPDSIQEWGMSSQTSWLMLWRLIGESHLSVHQGAWNFEQNFLKAYIYHSWFRKSIVNKTPFRNQDCPWRTERVNLD